MLHTRLHWCRYTYSAALIADHQVDLEAAEVVENNLFLAWVVAPVMVLGASYLGLCRTRRQIAIARYRDRAQPAFFDVAATWFSFSTKEGWNHLSEQRTRD